MDTVGMIIEFESGTLGMRGTLDLFAELIRTGQAWTLQGFYGRVARALIADGFISPEGEILERGAEIVEDK